MTLQTSIRRSGGASFDGKVRDGWSFSVAAVRLFVRYRPRNLIPWRVTGAWWPPRSSKPLAVRLSDRSRFDSYPLRLFWLELNKADWAHYGKSQALISTSGRPLNSALIGNDRLNLTETETFEGGDHNDTRANPEVDLAFIMCRLSFET